MDLTIVNAHEHLWHWHDKSDKQAYVDEFLANQAGAGIGRICLSGLGRQFGFPDNQNTYEMMQAHPDRIIGFGYFRLGVDSPDKIETFRDMGFRGVKFTCPLEPYDNKEYYPVYEAVEEEGMPALFHTGIVMRSPRDREYDVSTARMRPAYLDAVARAFPELIIIGGHMGNPWYAEAAELARVHPNVFWDLTGSTMFKKAKTPEYFREVLWWPGAAEKLIFGADGEDPARCVKFYEQALDALNAGSDVCEQVFGGSITRFLGLH